MAGILALQIRSVLGKKEVNFRKVDHFIKINASKSLDLVVLPEFFATNNDYMNSFEPEDGGASIEFVKGLARKYNTNIVAGSVVRRVEGKLYNTSFAINREGEVIAKYDKIHLYDYFGGSEGDRITPGQDVVVVDFDFAKVGLAICFDIRFPLHFNKLIKLGADIIVLPTAWLVQDEIYQTPDALKTARDMWRTMCRTRTYDNCVYFVVSNQTKAAANGLSGLGETMVVAPNSEIINSVSDKEDAVYANIDLETLKYYRQLFPVAALD